MVNKRKKPGRPSRIARHMPRAPKPFVHYRQSTLGHSLHDSLKDMINDDGFPEELALNIFSHFDKAMAARLKNVQTTIPQFTGELALYRNCDDVWTFVIKKAQFLTKAGERISSDCVKIVACDSDRS